MAEALLRARDAGDLAAAQKALTQLAAMSPDDKAVQRLRSEIEAQATAQQVARPGRRPNRPQSRRRAAPPPAPVVFAAPPAAERAATPAANPAPVMVDVRIPEPGQSVVPSARLRSDAGAGGRGHRPGGSARINHSRRDRPDATRHGPAQLRADQPGGRHRHGRCGGSRCRRIRSPNSSSPTSNGKSLASRAQVQLKRGNPEGARAAIAAHDRSRRTAPAPPGLNASSPRPPPNRSRPGPGILCRLLHHRRS